MYNLTPKQFTNISATTAAFVLPAGQYGITVNGTWNSTGTATLQRLGADGSTYVTCVTAFSADGYATANMPAGTYKIAVATATAVYIDISPIVATL